MTEERLIRAIGVRRLAASIVNATIGAGIFALPALVAADLGAAAPAAYIVCGLAMALIVTCMASAGSRVSLTGGPYAYTHVAFGPFAGYLCGVLLWLSCTLAVAAVAAALTDSMGVLVPALTSGAARSLFLVALFATLALVNIRGVTAGARLIEAVTIAKLLPLAVLIAGGLWFAPVTNLAGTPIPDPAAVGRASLVLIYAFLGIELALVPSGEVRDPARTVPRAVFLALAATTTIYLLVQVVVQAALGGDMAAFASAPLAEAGGRLLGAWGRPFLLAGATVSMFGYVSGDMLATPRLIFAVARDGVLPAAVAAVHPRFRTPSTAIAAHAIVAASLAITSGFAQLSLLTNLATLSMYLLCVAASFELQRRDVRTGTMRFAVPGGPVIPAVAAMVILWLLWHATSREFALEAIVISLAAVLYLLRRRAAPWLARTLRTSAPRNS
jgi:amino acid transporter